MHHWWTPRSGEVEQDQGCEGSKDEDADQDNESLFDLALTRCSSPTAFSPPPRHLINSLRAKYRRLRKSMSVPAGARQVGV